jgi:hypothetical protein
MKKIEFHSSSGTPRWTLVEEAIWASHHTLLFFSLQATFFDSLADWSAAHALSAVLLGPWAREHRPP